MLSNPLDFEKPIAELDALIDELKKVSRDENVRSANSQKGIDIEAEIVKVEGLRDEKMRQIYATLTPWNEVQVARHQDRPYTLDYINAIFTDFVELHGDRTNADDPAIVGGMARFNGESVVVLGHQKGRDLKSRQHRNFGSARPAGFRKAIRIMKLAEKFRKPLLVFIDTPAAEANLMAEEEGISRFIALSLKEMALLRTPIIITVIGEGGSGGALGIAVGDRIVMLEHAVYSVAPPEGCAAILWKDRAAAPDAAAALKLTARHACEFELVDEVLPEPLGGAHRNPAAMAETLKSSLQSHLTTLRKFKPDALIEARYNKFRAMGRWLEEED